MGVVMLSLAESHILSLGSYVPGRSIENSSKITSWAKLGSNENCLGPSPKAIMGAAESFAVSHLYPNAHREIVIEKLCHHFKEFSIIPKQVALGNGSSELIVNIVRSFLGPEQTSIFFWPTFVVYELATKAHGRKSIKLPLTKDMSYDLERMLDLVSKKNQNRIKIIFIANPNNPTGNFIGKSDFHHFVNKLPEDVILVIDEAYYEYVTKENYPNGINYANCRPRTLVLRTFSKIYGLAGFRMGYAIGDRSIIEVLNKIKDPFNVNVMAQYAAIKALDDKDHVKKSIEHNEKYRPLLANRLRDMGFLVNEKEGNFLMIKKHESMENITTICDELLHYGIIIRPLESFGLKDWARISVGSSQQIEQLFAGLNQVLCKKSSYF